MSAGLELSDEEFAVLAQVHDDGSYFDPGSAAGRACELDPFDPQSQLDRAADATFDWRK